MSSELKSMRLQDFVTLQRGHDLTESERKPGNIPVYGSFGMSGYHNAAKAKGPGVTVGRSGASFGVVNYCPVDFWPHNTALYVIDFHGNNEKFAYYYLKNLDFTRFNSGSAQASLNRNYIHPMEVKIPPLPTQHAIARILGSLDDKIELNRQMNETLEAIARAIFRSWFVDFEPVRAKAEGRDTGLPPEVAALFPSEIVEVDGREVPKGWGVETLGNFVGMTTGRSYTSDELQESTTALVTLKSFQRGGGYRQDGLKPFIGKYKPEQVIQPGELVISFTDVTQAAEVIGKPALVSANPDFQTLVASLDVGIIRPKDERVNIPFFYLLLRNDDYQSHIYGYCSGTTVLHLNKSGVPKYEFICPDPEIMKIFFNISKPIFDGIENNIQQSRTLAQIRDALLPRLMSGEI
jgi:type I restriction enzyme, S subunit